MHKIYTVKSGYWMAHTADFGNQTNPAAANYLDSTVYESFVNETLGIALHN